MHRNVLRPAHGRQRGQVVPLVGLLGLVLIGATTLAVDLSLQTSDKRTLQNVADTAALAGAHDLYTTASLGTDQVNAVDDALTAIDGNMGWTDLLVNASACPGYPTTAMNTLGFSSGACMTSYHSGYTVTVSTPPKNPVNVVDLDTHDVEVDMTQTESTNFAAAIGFTSATQRAHAVARHGMSGSTLGYALFANGYIQTGNSISVVNGDVYAGRAVDLQASGASAFCANTTTSTSDDGYIFLGAPQYNDSLGFSTASPGQHDMNPITSKSITPVSSKPLSGSCTEAAISSLNLGGWVMQSGPKVQSSPQTCPTPPSGGPAFYNSNVGACEVAPIVAPPAPVPSTAGAVVYKGHPCKNGHEVQCWNSAPASGTYVVYHDTTCTSPSCYDLQVRTTMTVANLTIILMPGATFDVNMNGTGGSFTVGAPATSGSPFVIYGESGSSFDVVGASTSVTLDTGSIYMPDGTVTASASTADIQLLAGQAVVDNWDVSSGNLPNPQITYNASYAAVSGEAFRLVE